MGVVIGEQFPSQIKGIKLLLRKIVMKMVGGRTLVDQIRIHMVIAFLYQGSFVVVKMILELRLMIGSL